MYLVKTCFIFNYNSCLSCLQFLFFLSLSASSSSLSLSLSIHALFASDGPENAGKCPHLESEESDTSFRELSNGEELKSPQKSDGPDLDMPSLACNGALAGALASPEGSKAKTDPEKKFTCGICGQAFRTKSYLNKHQHRVHKAQRAHGVSGSGLSEMAPSLTSPFSPQQNMSLLESFGFQIVQSAFASSLVDTEAGQSGIDFGGK